MEPKKINPKEVYRIIDKTNGQAVGVYSRAYHDEFDFKSEAEARDANCSGIHKNQARFAVAKYIVTYTPAEKGPVFTADEIVKIISENTSLDGEKFRAYFTK
jgi:hypothetical protein